jgi:hypothetical protein
MYATSSPIEIYHLLASTNEVTLCGRKVSRPEINVKVLKEFSLHRAADKPADHSLCYHCAKAQRQTAVL